MKRITEQQSEILNVIVESVKTRGYPPTIKEIAEALGIGSTSSVFYQLRALQKKGFIRIDPGPRAIAVLELIQGGAS